MTQEEYAAMLHSPFTPSLEDFARMEEYDSNTAWRLDTGDLVNLLEAAQERLEAVMKVCSDAEGYGEALEVKDIHKAVRGEVQ